MTDITVTIGRPPMEVHFGENTAEAIRQSTLAQAAAISAQAYSNFRGTRAEGVADFAVGEYFSSAETGELRMYKRIAGSPFYQDQGDQSVVATKAYVADGFADRDMLGASDNTDQNYWIGPAGPNAPDRVSVTLTGQANIGVGRNSLANVTSGGNNVAVGRSALAALLASGGNTAVGDGALQYGQTITDCTAVGSNAGQLIVSGVGSTAIGKNSQQNSTVAGNNTSVGDSSMGDNTIGAANAAVGYQALRSNTDGGNNTALGAGAVQGATSSDYNTGIGWNALVVSQGNRNTALGSGAGSSHTSGDGNIFIGDQAGTTGQLATAANSIAIGASAVTTASNQIVLGTASHTDILAFGVPRFERDQNAQSMGRMRNNDSGSSAYAGIGVNASGNSWGMRMGSTAANSNALEWVVDAFGTPTRRMLLSTSGRLALGSAAMASPGAQIHSAAADGTQTLGLSGTTKGIRVETNSTSSVIRGVDNTLGASYQPITLGGSQIIFEANGTTEKLRINASGYIIFTGGLGNYANDAAAAAGSVPVNGLYRNGSILMIRVV